jgi:hypothetical protein
MSRGVRFYVVPEAEQKHHDWAKTGCNINNSMLSRAISQVFKLGVGQPLFIDRGRYALDKVITGSQERVPRQNTMSVQFNGEIFSNVLSHIRVTRDSFSNFTRGLDYHISEVGVKETVPAQTV